MKPIFLMIATLFLVFTTGHDAQAQFWKKLGDKIAEKAEGRILDDAGKATEKSIGKVEKEAADAVKDDGETKRETRTKAEKNNTSSQAYWPGSANKQATEANPLPENHTLAFTGSGPDLYLNYRMQVKTEQSETSQMKISMEMYVSPNKGGRSEMNMEMPVIGKISMAMLTNFDDPYRVIVLNDRKEAYSVIDISDVEEAEAPTEKYTITKLGEETLHGLACTHARATSEDGQSFDIWTTRELPGYESMLKLYKQNPKMGADGLWAALREADCEGFMVKLHMKIEDATSTMELTKIEKTTVPDAMLLVPKGYKESNGGWVKRFMAR